MKRIFSLLILSMLLAGCGGRRALLVATVQPQDATLACEQIKMQIVDNQSSILERMPHEDKRIKNATLAVGGYFLLAPWALIDLAHTDRREIEALYARNEHLRTVAREKECNMRALPRALGYVRDERVSVHDRACCIL